MEKKKSEELEGTYINLEKLEEHSYKVIEFISEELEVNELQNYSLLLDNIQKVISAEAEEPQNQSQDLNSSDLQDPDYIG